MSLLQEPPACRMDRVRSAFSWSRARVSPQAERSATSDYDAYNEDTTYPPQGSYPVAAGGYTQPSGAQSAPPLPPRDLPSSSTSAYASRPVPQPPAAVHPDPASVGNGYVVQIYVIVAIS